MTAMVNQHEAVEKQTEELENMNNSNMEDVDRQETPTSSTAPKERPKKISRKQQYQNDLTEKILQLAHKEEDQVDLELAAIGAKMKRKLNEEEIYELLDELNNVARQFFARKRRRTEIASVSVEDRPSTSAARNVVSMPPPQLQRQPQIEVQQPPPLQRQPQIEVQQEIVESGDILFGVSGPMPGYNLQYVSDPMNNNTYMQWQI